MPTASFRFLTGSTQGNYSKRMFAPKKATMDAWYKEARSVIPEIPDLKKTDWRVLNQDANLTYVKFLIGNTTGATAMLEIDRTTSSFG